MDQRSDLPVKVNVTKSVVLVSAILFTSGIYLIISTFTEWLYFSNYFRYIKLFDDASYGSIIFLLLSVVLPFIFPSNDFLNTSALVKKRLQNIKKRLVFSLGKIETSIIVFIILFLLDLSFTIEIIPAILIILLVISIFIQTPYQKEQKKRGPISGYKIDLLNYIDSFLSSKRYLSILTGGFFQQLFPSSENIFIYLIALVMPNLYAGIFTIIFIQAFHNLFIYWQVFDLSKRGGYFRHYVNILSSLILTYYAYLLIF